MDGARAALADAAPVLRASEIQHVAQHPQQRHVGRNVYRRGLLVDDEVQPHVTCLLWHTVGPMGLVEAETAADFDGKSWRARRQLEREPRDRNGAIERAGR